MVSRAGTFLVIAPLIGPYLQGFLVIFSAWAAVISLLTAYGFQVKVLRELPTLPDQSYAIVRTDLRSMIILSLPTAALLSIAAVFLTTSSTIVPFVLVAVSTLISVAIDYSSCALRGLDRFAIETKLSVFSASLQFGLAVWLGLLYRNLLAVTFALFLSRLIALSVSLYCLFAQQQIRDTSHNVSDKNVKTNIIKSWPYLVDASLSVGIAQIDLILLGLFADKSTLGIYGAGSRFLGLFLSIPWMVTNIAVPKILRASASQRARETLNLYLLMAAVGISGAVAFIFVAPLLTVPVLGPKFRSLDALWPYLGFLLLARFLEQTMAMRMLIEDRMRIRVVTQIVALSVIVGIGVPLIYRNGAIGMLIALTCSSALTAVVYMISLSRSVLITNKVILE